MHCGQVNLQGKLSSKFLLMALPCFSPTFKVLVAETKLLFNFGHLDTFLHFIQTCQLAAFATTLG